MTTKIFLLGGVGSGKSTAGDQLGELARSKGIPVTHIDPYDILKTLHQEDKDHIRSKPIIENGKEVGFEVIDTSMYDEANHAFVEQIRAGDVNNSNGFILIELASRNYAVGFKKMQEQYPEVFSNAHFLFISKPLEKRVVDIENRNLSLRDDAPFLNQKLVARFQDDGETYITSTFRADFDLAENQIRFIENKSEVEIFKGEVEQYAKETFFPSIGKETLSPKTTIEGEPI